MATKPPSRPSAEWTGVIEIGDLVVDGRLFSAISRRREYPLIAVHTQCQTALDLTETTSPAAAKKDKKPTAAVGVAVTTPDEAIPETAPPPRISPVAIQIFCAACNRVITTDEIGKAYQMGDGRLILLTADLARQIQPLPLQRIQAYYIKADDPWLEVVPAVRRLYFFAKPVFVDNYYKIWETLRRGRKLGFIRDLVIGREKLAYSAVLRPILVLPEMADGQWRKILAVDTLRELTEVKQPTDLTTLPQNEPLIPTDKIKRPRLKRLAAASFRDPRFRGLEGLSGESEVEDESD